MHLKTSGKWLPFCLGFNVLSMHFVMDSLPAGHTSHAGMPLNGAYIPAGQGWGLVEFSGHSEPAVHRPPTPVKATPTSGLDMLTPEKQQSYFITNNTWLWNLEWFHRKLYKMIKFCWVLYTKCLSWQSWWSNQIKNFVHVMTAEYVQNCDLISSLLFMPEQHVILQSLDHKIINPLCIAWVPGHLLTKKMLSNRYRNPYYKPKMVWQQSQVYNGNPFTNKMVFS